MKFFFLLFRNLPPPCFLKKKKIPHKKNKVWDQNALILLYPVGDKHMLLFEVKNLLNWLFLNSCFACIAKRKFSGFKLGDTYTCAFNIWWYKFVNVTEYIYLFILRELITVSGLLIIIYQSNSVNMRDINLRLAKPDHFDFS